MGASGIGLEGLAPGGSGGGGGEVTLFEVVADAGFLSVDLDLPAPPPPPARCQTAGVSVSAGGRGGGSEHFLITSRHRFCSTRAPGRSLKSPQSALTHLAQCLFGSSATTRPGEVPSQ